MDRIVSGKVKQVVLPQRSPSNPSERTAFSIPKQLVLLQRCLVILSEKTAPWLTNNSSDGYGQGWMMIPVDERNKIETVEKYEKWSLEEGEIG